jgi:hypothetical protein
MREGFTAIMDVDAFFAPPFDYIALAVVVLLFACNCSRRLLSLLVTLKLNR